jgi:hypothetical protein
MSDLRLYLRKQNPPNTNYEGSCYNQTEQCEILKNLTKGKNKGLEIGFNAGDSAYLFLKQGCQLTSKKYNTFVPQRHINNY